MAEEETKKKANSVAKRARQNLKRRARNSAVKSSLGTITKKFLAAVDSGDRPLAEGLYRDTVRAFDKAVTKNVIHKNKASRKKSRMANHLLRVDEAVKTPEKKRGGKKSS